MKCTGLLTQDHKVILRAIDVLEDMAKRVRNARDIDREDVQAILRFLRAFADEYHQTKEESTLFPALRAAQPQERPLREMMFEHDEERSLVNALEDALHTRHGSEFVYLANRLTALLRRHIDQEDSRLFPLVERSLSPDQDENVASQLTKFKTDPALFADLCRLEWKYLKENSSLN